MTFLYMTKQNKIPCLHKVIHYNTVKTIYNVTIKKNTQAAPQRYSEKSCKFRAKFREL